jgi:glycosyltransferase involved in cell wall biosynthesis
MGDETRILWIHQNFVSPGQAGNERPTYTIAAMLERGWSVDLVTGTQGYQGCPVPEGVTGDSTGRFRWHRILSGDSRFFENRAESYLLFLARAVRAIKKLPVPDLVFASTPPLPQIVLSIIVASRHRAPLVLEVRDLWPGFLRETGLVRSPLVLAGLDVLEASAYDVAAEIVSVSPAFRPYLEAFGVEPERISEAPHGAASRKSDVLSKRGREWRARMGLTDEVVVLYAGSLNETHGARLVLEAARHTAKSCPKLRWVIAGNGRDRPLVEAAVRSLDNLSDLGPLPRRELESVLGAADVGLVALAEMASFTSVLPGKLVDCLSAGLPVLCSVPGQASRLVQVSGGGWICAPNSLAMARTMERIASLSPEELARRGIAGKTWVRDRMSAEEQGRTVAAVCARALEQGRNGRGVFGTLDAVVRQVVQRQGQELLTSLYDKDGFMAARAFDEWLEGERSINGNSARLPIPDVLR